MFHKKHLSTVCEREEKLIPIFGPQGEKGDPGPRGEKGDTGPTGQKGDKGDVTADHNTTSGGVGAIQDTTHTFFKNFISYSNSGTELPNHNILNPTSYTTKGLYLTDVGVGHNKINTQKGSFNLTTNYPVAELSFLEDRWIQTLPIESQPPWYPTQLSPINPISIVPGSNDGIGFSVDTSHDGKQIVAGSPGIVGEGTPMSPGSTIISILKNNVWQSTKFSQNIPNGGEGFAVASSRSGYVVASSIINDTTPPFANGSVIIYRSTDQINYTTQKIIPTTYLPTDTTFGFTLALSADGNTLAVGGQSAGNNTGGLWIFKYNGVSFVELVRLPFVMQTSTSESVVPSLSENGDILAVYEVNSSTLYIYKYFSNSNSYIKIQTINNDSFKEFVDLTMSQDGRYIALSFINQLIDVGGLNNGIHDGYVIIYESNNFVYSQQAIITVNVFSIGGAVSLSATGKTLAVGGVLNNNGNGMVFIFTRNIDQWVLQNIYQPSGPSVNPPYNFGNSIALIADGRSAVVGAPQQFIPNGETLPGPGAVFLLI